jgi:N-acetylglucosaminyldiphosphoundecaprenol N-acetyl-beta-D-mannosaminyltransferase
MGTCEIRRANLLGVGISAIDMNQAVALLESSIESGIKGYVCVTGVHGIMEAQKDPGLRRILNESLLTTPDGMPTVWIGRVQGFGGMERVFGPDLMLRVCETSCKKGYTHFLYGGGPGIAQKLRSVLTSRFPDLKVVGTYTPPFRSLNEQEESELRQIISAAKPDILWVGLSTPKQEQFMARYISLLDTKLMVGVGAAFDLHTGLIRDAPDWIKKAGLQWLHRLWQEPARLWKRYLVNNPLFIWRITLQLIGLSQYPL